MASLVKAELDSNETSHTSVDSTECAELATELVFYLKLCDWKKIHMQRIYWICVILQNILPIVAALVHSLCILYNIMK